jgi:hypothetical protein
MRVISQCREQARRVYYGAVSGSKGNSYLVSGFIGPIAGRDHSTADCHHRVDTCNSVCPPNALAVAVFWDVDDLYDSGSSRTRIIAPDALIAMRPFANQSASASQLREIQARSIV